jgi:hypothetical protein
MIRDPSDGTVKEINPEANKINTVAAKQAPKGIDTGIRQPTRTDAQERMEKSREFIRDYYAKKETAHARGSNGEEYQADGRSGNDQGEGQP